jgi:hypothetical protein
MPGVFELSGLLPKADYPYNRAFRVNLVLVAVIFLPLLPGRDTRGIRQVLVH